MSDTEALSVDHIEVGRDGITIDGHHIHGLTVGTDIEIVEYGPDSRGEELISVTLTVYTKNVTVGELADGACVVRRRP